MKKLIFIFFTLSILLTVCPAGEIEVSAQAGNTSKPGLNYSFFSAGAACWIPVKGQWSAEVECFYHDDPFKDFPSLGISESGYAWELNLLGFYTFPSKKSKIKLYVGGGLGLYSIDNESQWELGGVVETYSNKETLLRFSAGVGFKIPFGKKFGIRVDGRLLWGFNGGRANRISGGVYAVL